MFEPAALAEQSRSEAAAQTALFLETIHACFLLGAHPVPVNPAWRDAQATNPRRRRGFANSAMRAAMDGGLEGGLPLRLVWLPRRPARSADG
jgi:hypothetical protein